MIRKVPNIKAWVLRPKDVNVLLKANPNIWIEHCMSVYNLPILDSRPSIINEDLSDIILVTNEMPFQEPFCLYNEDCTMKMEYIEEINRIWNRFYDESTRK